MRALPLGVAAEHSVHYFVIIFFFFLSGLHTFLPEGVALGLHVHVIIQHKIQILTRKWKDESWMYFSFFSSSRNILFIYILCVLKLVIFNTKTLKNIRESYNTYSRGILIWEIGFPTTIEKQLRLLVIKKNITFFPKISL